MNLGGHLLKAVAGLSVDVGGAWSWQFTAIAPVQRRGHRTSAGLPDG